MKKEGWENSGNKYLSEFKKAYEFAAKAHDGQLRDEGTPYIAHIDGILDIFMNELGNRDWYTCIVICLHDVLEDTNYSYDDMVSLFGQEYAYDVLVLTKEEGMDTGTYIDRIKNYKYSSIITTIKLCDRLHNVRSLQHILTKNAAKVESYIQETEQFYLPWAKEFSSKLYSLLMNAINEVKGEIYCR